jgi:hypothetical protein
LPIFSLEFGGRAGVSEILKQCFDVFVHDGEPSYVGLATSMGATPCQRTSCRRSERPSTLGWDLAQGRRCDYRRTRASRVERQAVSIRSGVTPLTSERRRVFLRGDHRLALLPDGSGQLGPDISPVARTGHVVQSMNKIIRDSRIRSAMRWRRKGRVQDGEWVRGPELRRTRAINVPGPWKGVSHSAGAPARSLSATAAQIGKLPLQGV